jgi:hypothetical protein
MESLVKNGAVMKIAKHCVSNKIVHNVMQIGDVAEIKAENCLLPLNLI